MRSDIVPGGIFPDYELPDHTGKVTTVFTSDRAHATAVAIRSINGVDSIVAAGTTANDSHLSPTGEPTQDDDIALAHYSLAGDLVPSFGPNHDGKVTTDIYQGTGFFHGDDEGNAMAIQANSKIVVAGSATRFPAPGIEARQKDFAIARYISSIAGTICLITCPANVSVFNDPGLGGANVNYPVPTTGTQCGTVTCAPASGSFFSVGATTVTCANSAGPWTTNLQRSQVAPLIKS